MKKGMRVNTIPRRAAWLLSRQGSGGRWVALYQDVCRDHYYVGTTHGECYRFDGEERDAAMALLRELAPEATQ